MLHPAARCRLSPLPTILYHVDDTRQRSAFSSSLLRGYSWSVRMCRWGAPRFWNSRNQRYSQPSVSLRSQSRKARRSLRHLSPSVENSPGYVRVIIVVKSTIVLAATKAKRRRLALLNHVISLRVFSFVFGACPLRLTTTSERYRSILSTGP